MIVMAVAQNQGVELRRIDAQKFEIVVERIGGEAEIDEQFAALIATAGIVTW
jgi:hypothetical protein